MPSAKQIDDACRANLFVFYGDRQGILGAVAHRTGEITIKGRVWVNRAVDFAWEYIDANTVVITTETLKRKVNRMPLQGKGRTGAPTHHLRAVKRAGSKKSDARANNGNQELPTMEADQRRIKKIEEAEEARQAASAAISQANTDYEEAEKRVIDAMHDAGFDADKNPVYTRPPWGTVVLTKSGEVKEKVKFTAATKKPKKKKNADDSDSEE